MSHRADGALMAGDFGVFRMDVDSLGEAGKSDQQDTSQRQQLEKRAIA
ncbi:MAG: hypothetical protein WBM11_00675 [Terriglobales bacterium]